jgi:hypothetical protein
MTQITNDPIHKRLAVYAEEEVGCTFIGLSDEKEVFISFEGEYTDEFEAAAKNKIKDHFGDEITTIATVVSVSMDEVTRLVDGLNKTIEELEEEEKPKTDLLNIGSF